MRRITLIAAWLACLVSLGCVEGEQTYTLNPDGSGKVKFDIVTAAPFDPLAGPAAKTDDTIDGLRTKAIKGILESPGVAAWKDVSADFAPDGRLKFVGTAYFKQLDTFGIQNMAFLRSDFALTPGADGSLTLVRSKKDPMNKGGLTPNRPGKKSPDELAKLTDPELDAYIMRERVEYQSIKPFIIGMLTDAKLKTTLVLPGEVGGVRGFQPEGKNGVSFVMDGNKLIVAANKLYAQDNEAFRKMYRSGKTPDDVLESFGVPDRATATVAKPGKPQFDFEAEVKAARDAYPDLRKKLKIGENVRLPDGTSTVPKSAPPRKMR
jgi:hypothetical protein